MCTRVSVCVWVGCRDPRRYFPHKGRTQSRLGLVCRKPGPTRRQGLEIRRDSRSGEGRPWRPVVGRVDVGESFRTLLSGCNVVEPDRDPDEAGVVGYPGPAHMSGVVTRSGGVVVVARRRTRRKRDPILLPWRRGSGHRTGRETRGRGWSPRRSSRNQREGPPSSQWGTGPHPGKEVSETRGVRDTNETRRRKWTP